MPGVRVPPAGSPRCCPMEPRATRHWPRAAVLVGLLTAAAARPHHVTHELYSGGPWPVPRNADGKEKVPKEERKHFPRPGESNSHACNHCCMREGYMNDGSFCDFPTENPEKDLDECLVICGDRYPLPASVGASFLQTRSRSRIVHEAFEALAARDRRLAAQSTGLATDADAALRALTGNTRSNVASLNQVASALRAVAGGERSASVVAVAAAKDDAALAHEAKVAEGRAESEVQRARREADGLVSAEPRAVPMAAAAARGEVWGCSLACLRKTGHCVCSP